MDMGKLEISVLILALCLSFIPSAYSFSNFNNVTLELKFDMSGKTYSAFADNYSANGTYNSSNISKYYSCINSSDNYTTGLVFTGTGFISEENINQSNNYTLRMTQSMAGSGFVIPIFPGSCSVINEKVSTFPGYMNGPFVKFLAEGAYMAVLSLSYPGVDFTSPIGSEFSNDASLLLRRNETGNITQIIMEKR